jgi:membrane-associated phospholipid phosphatase
VAGLAHLAAGQLLRTAVALSIDRARPPAADWAWHASGPALPSGHTTTSAMVAGLFVVAALHRLRGRARAALIPVAVLWAFAVGATRVHLGMHWPTDVLAGWLLAVVWVALVAPLVHPAPVPDRAAPIKPEPAQPDPVGRVSRALGRSPAAPAQLQRHGDHGQDHDDGDGR